MQMQHAVALRPLGIGAQERQAEFAHVGRIAGDQRDVAARILRASGGERHLRRAQRRPFGADRVPCRAVEGDQARIGEAAGPFGGALKRRLRFVVFFKARERAAAPAVDLVIGDLGARGNVQFPQCLVETMPRVQHGGEAHARRRQRRLQFEAAAQAVFRLLRDCRPSSNNCRDWPASTDRRGRATRGRTASSPLPSGTAASQCGRASPVRRCRRARTRLPVRTTRARAPMPRVRSRPPPLSAAVLIPPCRLHCSCMRL